MGLSMFNIGVTAMQTTNQLLDITSHNIANANTPGYTVQDATMQAIPSGLTSATGVTGNGVNITNIQRIYDQFVNSQLNTENSNLSYWNNYNTGISQVEDAFNEASSTGISPLITKFFSDWQNVAQNPQQQSQRTTLIQDAGYLSSRLNTASSSLQNQQGSLLSDCQSLVTQVNSDISQIAYLNLQIAGNAGALDLTDQRDQLVQSLNKIVKVTTYQNSNGTINLVMGGTPLVQIGSSYNMSVNTDTSNKLHFYVQLQSGAVQGSAENPDVTSLVTGGQLKADKDLRDTDIPNYLTQLNAFAVNLADQTNYYQKQGYGLDGNPGQNFFQSLALQGEYNSNSIGSGSGASDGSNVSGVFTAATTVFSNNGGTLTIKLGDNDAAPATVNIGVNQTLNQVAGAINAQAGSKVTASVINIGTTTAPDFRISIKSNPDGRLRDVRISVASGDSNGSGLKLLNTSAEITSTSVTSVNSLNSQAQYKIDYNYAGGAGYQQEDLSVPTGRYWRVQKSTDGVTWTTITPNTNYIPSNPSTLNELQVNMTADTTGTAGTTGHFWRTLEFEGIKVRIDGNGISSTTNPNGETYDVQLDQNAATDISTSFTDPNKVAASTDMYTVDSTNNTVIFNVNGTATTATVPAGSYDAKSLAAAFTTAVQSASGVNDTYTVAFNANTKQFKIIKTIGANAIQFMWANASSTARSIFGFTNNSATITAVGDSTVSDTPGSVLSSANKGLPGDNRNATSIANLASGTAFGGSTPVDFYNSLVSNVGVKSASAKNNQQYESNLVDQLTERRSQVSGVSLDQEAANLVIYQKAYQAAAQLITVANTLLTTLMQMIGK